MACVGAPWHFKDIEVKNLLSGVAYRFVYDAWLERTKDNPGASVTLKEASSAGGRAAVKMVGGRPTGPEWTGGGTLPLDMGIGTATSRRASITRCHGPALRFPFAPAV